MIILALSVLFCFIACNDDPPEECTEHTDKNEDGICDVCDAEVEPPEEDDGIILIEEEEILFGIVLGSDISLETRIYVDDMIDVFDELGYELSVIENNDDEVMDVEILIGTVTGRGKDYEYFRYSLGIEGYAITAIDETKIAIAGGSDESLLDAVKEFFEEYLAVDEDAGYLEDFIFTEEHDVVEIQDDYRITSVTVNGNDVSDYVITKNPDYSETNAVAKKLQAALYEKVGIWLPIVNEGDEDGSSIQIKAVGKSDAGSKGFRVVVDGDDLLLECAYMNMYDKLFDEYSQATFFGAKGEVSLEAYTPEINATRVYYSDFGAVGDGRTDDYEAIKAAHEFANKSGQLVTSESNTTYYMGKGSGTISIKTNVDFNNCKFIFDDSALTGSTAQHVFSVDSNIPLSEIRNGKYFDALNADEDNDGIVIKGINHGNDRTTKLDLGLGYPALLTVYDTTSNMYIRWGYTDGQNHTQEEIVLIDAEGNIDPSTPFLVDYERLRR